MPYNQLNQYGYLSGSEFEDVSTISRIGSAEMQLQGKFTDYHRDILKNWNLLAGHIYKEADLRKLWEEGRPDFEWNLFLPIILAIVGNFKSAIPGIDVTGITEDDHKGAKLQKTLFEYILETANDGSYELSKAFLYSIVARIGWLKTSYGYNNDKEGMTNIEWYDSMRLKFDTNWQRRDTRDLRFMSDSGWYEASEVIDIYARKKPSLREEIYEKATMLVGESAMKKGRMRKMMLSWAERYLNVAIDYKGNKHGYDSDLTNVNYNFNGTWYNGDGRFKVVDWYEKRAQPIMEIYDLATGKKEDISDEVVRESKNPFDEKEWFDREKLQIVKQRFQEPRITQYWDEIVWQTSVVPALNLVLHDEPQKFQSGNFKFVPIFCFDLHPQVMEYKSIMDHISDPVSSYNMRRNTILTYLMRIAHGGMIAEKDAVKGLEDELMKNDLVGLKIVNTGALSDKRVQEIKPPPYPEGLRQEAEDEKNDTDRIAAVPPNAKGFKESSGESGTLFRQRVEQSDIMHEWISDNAQAALILVAKNIVAINQRFLKANRTIPLLMDQTNPYWLEINKYYLGKIINDVSYGKYNIKISKMPYGKYQKDREFQKIMELNNWLQTLNPAFVDPITTLEMSNLTAADKMIQHIKNVLQQQDIVEQEAEYQRSLQDDFVRKENEAKLQQMLLSLDQKTLENRKMADEISSQSIMNQLSSSNNFQSNINPTKLLTQ